METLPKYTDLIISLIFVCVGIGMCIYNLLIIIKSKKTQNWIQTNGLITKSELGISDNIGPNEKYYRANIEYEFKAFGNLMKSNQVYIGDKLYSSSKWRSEDIIDKYKLGDKVDVYYNPNSINESILIKGSFVSSYIFTTLGVVTIFLGVTVYQNFSEIINFFQG